MMNNDLTMQDVDGRHLLSGAPETASPPAQRDCHNVRILPLQSHHGEAADVAQCGPGRWSGRHSSLRGYWWVLNIDISSLLSLSMSPWRTSLSPTPE